MRLGKIYLCFEVLKSAAEEKMAKSTGEKIAEKLKKGKIMRFHTDFKYTSRKDKPEYVWRKYMEILHGRILDVGADECGLRKFLPEGTEYIGIGLGGSVDVEIDSEKEKLPYADNSFDCVLCLDVLEHLDNLHEVFDELCRVTRKYLIISLPNPWVGFLGMLRRGYYNPGVPMKFYNLPTAPPTDRHKWFYGVHEAERFLNERGRMNNLEVLYMDRENAYLNLKKRLYRIALKFVVHKDVDVDSLLSGSVWAVLVKKSFNLQEGVKIIEGKMPENPKISVIMSVYNGEKYLREAIESILNQTFTDFEFIIVNDGSTDNSLEIIQSYDDERIRIINNEKNIGLTKSLNKALKVAKGEYIARQDADDVSLPNRFEEQTKYFEEHPETALLGTGIYKIDKNGRIVGKRIVLAKTCGKYPFNGNRPLSHGCMMFKKKIIDELRGYNELFRYAQDYELWLRITKRYEVRNLTQTLYKLRVHDESVVSKRTAEQALYHLLAQWLIKNDLRTEILETIKNKSILDVYSYLNKSEKIYFHKTIAYNYTRNNNIELARNEFKKVLKLSFFDIKSYLCILLSYFGKNVMDKSCKVYSKVYRFKCTFRRY